MVINMFFSQAYAAGGAHAGPDMLMSIVPFILIFILMYFLMIRPQQKRAAEHQKMVNALEKGTKVVMTSGIVGVITRKREHEFQVEIADGVQVTVLKNAISGPYATPVETPAEAKKESAAPYHQPKAAGKSPVRRVRKSRT